MYIVVVLGGWFTVIVLYSHAQDAAYKEQLQVCGDELPPLNYDEVRNQHI